jgi:hypothetical protein
MVRTACQVLVFSLTALVSTAGKPSVAGDQPRYEVGGGKSFPGPTCWTGVVSHT